MEDQKDNVQADNSEKAAPAETPASAAIPEEADIIQIVEDDETTPAGNTQQAQQPGQARTS